jgi:hypothetical protein
MSDSCKWGRSMMAGVASLGLGISCLSGISQAAIVGENFNDDPATDADPNTNWQAVVGVPDAGFNYGFQAAGTATDGTAPFSPAGVNPPGGTATGPGEAGGTQGRGGFYGDVFPAGLSLNLTQPISVSGVFAIGGNEGGHFFGFANTANLPVPFTPSREGNPGNFLGFRTDSGGGPPPGHRYTLQIGDAVTGGANILSTTAFVRPDDANPPDALSGEITFNSVRSFTLSYDPGTAAGPNFGSISLTISGGVANDADHGETFTRAFTAANRPASRADVGDISYNTLAMFGNEGQTVFYDDLTYTSPVPEPASLGLLALGGLAMARRRRM